MSGILIIILLIILAAGFINKISIIKNNGYFLLRKRNFWQFVFNRGEKYKDFLPVKCNEWRTKDCEFFKHCKTKDIKILGESLAHQNKIRMLRNLFSKEVIDNGFIKPVPIGSWKNDELVYKEEEKKEVEDVDIV